jgi:hypothetical protein
MANDLAVYDRGFLDGTAVASGDLAMSDAARRYERDRYMSALQELEAREIELRALRDEVRVLWWVVAGALLLFAIESWFLFWRVNVY